MNEFSKELEAMGHVKVAHGRCTARYKNETQRVSGPPNLPVWCDLPAGHEGPHRHVSGHHSFIMDRAHLIEMVPLPEVCQSCGTVWPCKEAAQLTKALIWGRNSGLMEAAGMIDAKNADVLSKQFGAEQGFEYQVDVNIRMAAILLPDLADAIRTIAAKDTPA